MGSEEVAGVVLSTGLVGEGTAPCTAAGALAFHRALTASSVQTTSATDPSMSNIHAAAMRSPKALRRRMRR